jgi:hypothetical protein
MHKAGASGLADFKKFTDGDMHWSQLMSLLLLNVKRAV